jgi:peroxiredoxin
VKWLIRTGGVLIRPSEAFRVLICKKEGGISDLLLFAFFVMLGSNSMEVARVLFSYERGMGHVLQGLFDLYLRVLMIPMIVYGSLGLAVLGWKRFCGDTVPVDQVLIACLHLWIPVGVLDLLGERVSFTWVVGYGWSAWLFIRFLAVLRQADRDADVRLPKWGGAILAGCILLSYGIGFSQVLDHYDEIRPIRAGDRAPAFDLPQMDGRETKTLASFYGRPVVLEFWATWCPHCVAFMGPLDQWAAAHPDVAVVGIASGESREEIKNFVENRLWRHIQFLVDETGKVTNAYRVDTWPSVFVVDQNGKIARTNVGTVSEKWLDEVVQSSKSR